MFISMKKIFVAILCFALVFCAFGCTSKEYSPIEDFSYEIKDGEVIITGYKGTDRDLVIPEYISDRPVVSIDKEAFSEYDLVSITMPKGLVSIGKGAFSNCVCLERVIFQDGLISIGESAFKKCKSLKEFTIPESVEEIGPYAFKECTSLKSIDIPKKILYLDKQVFQKCESLESVSLPDTLVEIKNASFMSCRKLKNINIPSNVKVIDTAAFVNCESLESITFPNNLERIGEGAFDGCIKIDEVKIPDNTLLEFAEHSTLRTPFGFCDDESYNTVMIVSKNSRAYRQIMEYKEFNIKYRVE